MLLPEQTRSSPKTAKILAFDYPLDVYLLFELDLGISYSAHSFNVFTISVHQQLLKNRFQNAGIFLKRRDTFSNSRYTIKFLASQCRLQQVKHRH